MPLTFRIALRNLKEHKAKSIIIASLIALGMFLLVLGNSVLDTGKVGIRKSFMDNFSGHIIISTQNQAGQAVSMFSGSGGAQSSGGERSLPEYAELYKYLQARNDISIFTPQVFGAFQIRVSEDWRAVGRFFGIEEASYNRLFPDNLELVQGRFLSNDDKGFLLAESTWKEINDKTGKELVVGDTLTISGFGEGITAITLPMLGVVRYKTQNSSIATMSFMDLSSLRYLKGMVVGSTDQIAVDASEITLLGTDEIDFDALFTSDESALIIESSEIALEDVQDILGDTSQREAFNRPDNGAWSYILLRVTNEASIPALVNSLNKDFTEKAWKVAAANWEVAAGPIAGFVAGAQVFFLILVLILSVVCVIIIMNTMIVSINERTAEIGTMRALGAHKSYIREIFLAETMTLSISGGMIGLVLALILLAILNSTGMASPHPIFDIIFGGSMLYPVLSGSSVLTASVIMMLVGVLSSMYPTSVALRISPLKAMQS